MDSPNGEVEAPKNRQRGARKAKEKHSEAKIEKEAKAHKRETKKRAPKQTVDPSQVLTLPVGDDEKTVVRVGGAEESQEPVIVRSFSLG